jgi:hypothetical protein
MVLVARAVSTTFSIAGPGWANAPTLIVRTKAMQRNRFISRIVLFCRKSTD